MALRDASDARGSAASVSGRYLRFPVVKPIDFSPVCRLLDEPCVKRVYAILAGSLYLPYDLARIARAEPYLADVAAIAKVVELLRVRVLPAAKRQQTRQKSGE